MEPRYLVFPLCLSLIIGVTNAAVCFDTGNFTAGSAYGRNRERALSSLPSNVIAKGGFYNTSIGQEPDTVYALALCRGGYDVNDCFSCVNMTVQDILTTCPNQKEAYTWAGESPCLVRCADHAFFGSRTLDRMVAVYNTGNITSNLTEFDQIWESLASRLARKASMDSSGLKYGIEQADLPTLQTIYALMQCSPDLSQADCNYCLRDSAGQYKKCCHGKQGGVVFRPSCFFRWDLYPFAKAFNVAATPDSPPPSSPSHTSPNSTTSTPLKKNQNGGLSSKTVVAIVTTCAIIFLALVALTFTLFWRRKRKFLHVEVENADRTDAMDSLKFDLDVVRNATDNFSDTNKLGQGGFGAVYQGQLPDGRQIAVKRLSRNSQQGDTEFKNEVLLLARLQHKNLVKLIGFCLELNERILIYEFLSNSSLDQFIYDPVKRSLLDWNIRYKIIGGIARGLLYLHEDSQLRIVHRDLKVSNILLDSEMNPKISDFGMARLFAFDQTQGDTSKIAGTLGYMAPEYVRDGRFSVKSDVFSFGVLLLEVISGQKNGEFSKEDEAGGLLTCAWKNWKGAAVDVIDPILRNGCGSEIRRCLHIGLLCVQEIASRRPTMASVVLMLGSNSVTLPLPSTPAFFTHNTQTADTWSSSENSDKSRFEAAKFTVNEVSISELDPR